MSTTLLADELAFVGARKRVPWFQTLTEDPDLVRFVEEVQKGLPQATLRTVLYCLFAISRYVADRHRWRSDVFLAPASWQRFARTHLDEVIHLAATYGTQGNIPQRAAMVLDCARYCGLLNGPRTRVIELGCASGQCGKAYVHHAYLFRKPGPRKRYFWLTRLPFVPAGHGIEYLGVDRVIPPHDLVPYFVEDRVQRGKVARFVREVTFEGRLVESTAEAYLQGGIDRRRGTTLLVTSFMLYQLQDPNTLISLLMETVHASRGGVHWIDVSRNRDLKTIFSGTGAIPDHVYLSHNGELVARVLDGSDDCPNWAYL